MRWPWTGVSDREKDLTQEIQDHLDLEQEDREQAGLPPDDARRSTRRTFGNPAIVREDTREAWGWRWVERLFIDARLAIRMWVRTPGFSGIAILTIAIGIGASTAIVGQINAVFWKPLPVLQPEALRFVAWTAPRRPFVGGPNVLQGPRVGATETWGSFSYPAYVAMRDGSRAFTDLACWAELGEARPVVLGELGFGSVLFVSGNFFRTVGVRAAMGRTIEPADDQPGAWAPVAMVSHRFWQRTFGGDPNVTRHTMRLNGRPFGVIGVMPEGFFGMDAAVSPDVVIPIGAVEIASATRNPLQNRALWNPCRVVGRLRTGASEEPARIELEHWVHESIAAVPPPDPYDPPRIWLVDASHGLGTLRQATSAPLLILMVVVVGLLIASCANIAGLLLARGSARAKEIATRLALGASRGRVVRQLITESLVLSSAGGLLGLVLAYTLSGSGPNLLSQFMPTLFGADRALDVSSSPDARVLAFGVVAALVSGLLFSVVPALLSTRVDLIAIIKQASSSRTRRLGLTGGQATVAAQTAMAIVLLVGAGLLLRTVANLRSADMGFNADGLLYARVEPRSGGLAQEQRLQFFEDAVKRIAGVPGAVSASAAAAAPLSFGMNIPGMGAVTQPVCTPVQIARGLPPASVTFNFVAPHYFETLGISLVRGEDFTWSDNREGPSRSIVNEAFASAHFAGQDPIGQTIVIATDCSAPLAQFPVVGVVRNSRTDMRVAAEPTFYIPLRGYSGPVTLMLRTAGDPAAMVPTVRRAVQELNASIPTFSEAALSDLRERHLRQERLLSTLLTLFGCVTLLVCCLGIYGMLAYAVARRRSEISVRMAIGAQAGDVVRLMVRESLVPVAMGIVIGSGLALTAASWIDSLLFGVSAHDPLTFAGAALLFLAVAAAAAAIPARSASRIDPVLALRQ